MRALAESAEPVLFYDGRCGLCARSVRFVLAHERDSRLRFASLDGATAAALRERHPELASVDSLVWFEPGPRGGEETLFVRSAAMLRVAAHLRGPWRLLLLARALPRAVRDSVYDLVARHRHRLWAADERCLVGSAELGDRLLD